jgi:glyoxylase-like metal-dependent hydrolase (beta-lactamase superfamily II)
MSHSEENRACLAEVSPQATTFGELRDIVPGCYTYATTDGPISGILIGTERVMIIDAQPSAALAQDLIDRVRTLTEKPIVYAALTNFHAERVGIGYRTAAPFLIASSDTRDLLHEHPTNKSPIPTLTFRGALTIHLGDFDAEIFQPGRGATRGDTVVWIREHKLLYTGALIEAQITPDLRYGYASEWPDTVEALMSLRPERLVPGRGDPLLEPGACQEAMFATHCFIQDLYRAVQGATSSHGTDLKAIYRTVRHTLDPQYGYWQRYDELMPCNIARAYEEFTGTASPRTWTDAREQALRSLFGIAPHSFDGQPN